jgi:hypothetical protein
MTTQCTAKARTTGNQCNNPAMIGKTKCRMHGGKTPKGISSPHFKTGRYSKGNANLVAKYNEALANPTILSLKEDLATVDVRLNALWSQLEGSGTQQAWVDLDKQFKKLVKAQRAKDADTSTEALNEIGRLIQDGSKDTRLWSEFANLQDHRRKLFESQSRHYEREKSYTSNDILLLTFGAVLELISKTVDDREVKGKLADGIDHIINSTLISGG